MRTVTFFKIVHTKSTSAMNSMRIGNDTSIQFLLRFYDERPRPQNDLALYSTIKTLCLATFAAYFYPMPKFSIKHANSLVLFACSVRCTRLGLSH